MEQNSRDIIDSLNNYSRKKRTSETNRRNLNVLGDVEANDLVFDIYLDANERVSEFINGGPDSNGLTTNRQLDILRKLGPLFTDQDAGMPTNVYKVYIEGVYGPMLNNAMADYELVSRQVFDKFYHQAKNGSPGPMIGLVFSLRDPKLAKDLLQILYQESATQVRSSVEKYIEIGAFVIGGKEKTKRKRKKVFKEEISKKLNEIAAMPPMSIQLLWANLNGAPIENIVVPEID